MRTTENRCIVCWGRTDGIYDGEEEEERKRKSRWLKRRRRENRR